MRTSEPTASSRLLDDFCRSIFMVRNDEDFGPVSLTAGVDREKIAFLDPLLLESNDALAGAGGTALSTRL
jgi:hypothetical protein